MNTLTFEWSQVVWKGELTNTFECGPLDETYLRAAFTRYGLRYNWGVSDTQGALTGGSTLTYAGARRRCEKALARYAAVEPAQRLALR